MANKIYFEFLGTVWDLLPLEDRNRMAETWTGYEQIFASVYQKLLENDLNISIHNLQPYSTERWLQYAFDPTTKIQSPAVYNGTQDLSVGVNLSSRYMLKFSIDGNHPFEVDVRGTNPVQTTITEIVTKINNRAGFAFARTIYDGTIIQLVSRVSAPAGSIEIMLPTNNDATEYIFGIESPDLPQKFPKFPHAYPLPYDKVVSIPTFQTKIRDESTGMVTLSETTDYAVQANNIIAFKNEPPTLLWAKKTNLDEETPWHNFGFLMDIYQKNSANYLQVLQGLWYSYWTGPKPRNLQISLYLLFGLPVAPQAGTITRVTATEIDVTLSSNNAVFTFAIPSELVAIVTVGQQVPQYEPLVSGIEIIDKISKPGFIDEDIGRVGIQRFLLDEASRGVGDTDETKALTMLEEHTFLPQIQVEAFVTPNINLGNVRAFLDNIKPLTKTYLFQVIVGTFLEPLKYGDKIGLDISMDVTPNLDSNQTTWADSATLAAYETVDNPALNLDSDGVCMQEEVEIIVFDHTTVIDTFIA